MPEGEVDSMSAKTLNFVRFFQKSSQMCASRRLNRAQPAGCEHLVKNGVVACTTAQRGAVGRGDESTHAAHPFAPRKGSVCFGAPRADRSAPGAGRAGGTAVSACPWGAVRNTSRFGAGGPSVAHRHPSHRKST
uniref:Uncharacterized protein n=1 Tax=Ralstonia syzygii R24 TaxID=907261 RepID=G3AAP2_9RALS|nr:hypothetical protein RALSY_mp30784 [Ralstonia syzygii R24]